MNITQKKNSKSQIELTIEVSLAELQPYLTKAAKIISKEKKIPGFRPGKAPYDIVKKEVGEMAIYQQIVNDVISKTLFTAMNEEMESMEITGQPQIDIDKLAPGNPLVYRAAITLMPEIKIGDWQKIKIEKSEIKITPQEVDKILSDLRNMRAKETIKLGKLEKGDKVIVNFDIFIDRVPIEGGQAKDHLLIIGENKFIPGFEEQLIGLAKTETKEFELRFPQNYHQQNLASKLAKFKIEIRETYKRELPELNDEFAKTLGEYKSLEEIKKGIEFNLKQETENKEARKQEVQILDELIKVTTFEDIPDSLIKAEAHKMIHELEADIERQGLKFDDYLSHLKKTADDLQKEFLPEAKKRVQTALITRQLAKNNNLTANEEEIKKELEQIKKMYAGNQEALDNLKSPSYKIYLISILTNRKVIKFLKKELIK